MSTVVDQLLDVDSKARQVLDDANQYYQKTIEETQIEKEKLKTKYADKTKIDIANLKKDLYKNLDEELSNAKKKYNNLEQALLDTCKTNKSIWVKELFENCINIK